jgi:hypothetical protein
MHTRESILQERVKLACRTANEGIIIWDLVHCPYPTQPQPYPTPTPTTPLPHHYLTPTPPKLLYAIVTVRF